MRIAVNTRFLLEGKLEGLGRYTHEVCSRLVKNHPEHDFYFFFDRPFSKEFIYADNVKPIVLFPPARHPFLWFVWFQWSVKRALKKYKIDYFISPDSFLALGSKTPQHLVVHDLAFEHHPEGIPSLVAKYYKKYLPQFCKKANRIITVSEFTKQDVIKQYQIAEDKIDAILNGVDFTFSAVSEDNKKNIRQELTQEKPFFVYLGAMHPRKNISNLLLAFESFKKNTGSDFKLVLVGRKAWHNEEMEQVYNQLTCKDDIVFTGRVTDERLVEILSSAYALTYIPFFEGFGLPIIEAQACGIPVICSNTSSMPEVLGDGGLKVDPYDITSISDAMSEIVNETLYLDLKQKAKLNAQKFNWDTTASQFWNSVQKGMKDAGI